jgi:hypothetical protein
MIKPDIMVVPFLRCRSLRTWALLGCLLLGSACAEMTITDHYPDEIRKGRALIFFRSTDIALNRIPVYQEIGGDQKSIGKAQVSSSSGEEFRNAGGGGSFNGFCLLAYAPPGRTTFYVADSPVTVEIVEGMTTPIIVVLDPIRTSALGGYARISFEVFDPVNNLRVGRSECRVPWLRRRSPDAR